MTALQSLLESYRTAALTNREQGTYFEELTTCFLKCEPAYRELYRDVVPYAKWAERNGLDKRDVGIDLVAETFTGEVHAIQCKLYAPNHRIQKADIDSFFTASGKKPFTHRIIVTTTDLWSDHAEAALTDQHTPVTKIDLTALENSVVDWSRFTPRQTPVLKQKKSILPHQSNARDKVLLGLRNSDRGKLIMACGTGKTFTSLKIAEQLAGEGKRVLFLVPSLALLSQTLSEWTQESEMRLQNFAVCSDSDVGKRRNKDDDTVQTFVHELQYPATTDAARLASEEKRRHDAKHMSVVYATYHSIGVLHQAQKDYGLPEFDLIVCDEAHRTTGAKFEGEDESHFVRVHDADYIRGKKRLYMTATPRIFGDNAKATAERENVALCSMDDESLYGWNLCVLTFSESVKRGLLVDYKVIVLAVEEKHVSRRIQNLLKDENNELRVDDAAKIIGCWKALAKKGLAEELTGDDSPMKRAVAFCQVIERQKGATVHKVSSKHIAAMFQSVVEAYQENETDAEGDASTRLRCEAEHIDGSMNASQKEAKINWLKASTPDDTCRILSNVRCLSEGVDVPALDAVLFLTPRNSQIDVVQSVGRVMRNSPGKKRGYIVLPVVIPAGVEPHEALNDNQTYKVVWQVLQALRSHDDRFDAMINKLDLIGKDPTKMEVIAITDKIAMRTKAKSGDGTREATLKAAKGGRTIGSPKNLATPHEQRELEFEIGEIERAIYAKLVQKVGNRHHWEDWANDIAKIANTHILRISQIVGDPKNTKEVAAFNAFADELRDDLNDSITDAEVIEMLAQHLITKPVFDALFKDYSFANHNPVSQAMQKVLAVLQEHRLEKEADTLEKFYASVAMRAEGIDKAEGKQKIVVELYEKFFKNAFGKMTDRLGIVYTPVEIVDFIIHSINDLLQQEFGQTLGSKGVHILDPFTGTGTFITRLLQSGLIKKDELPHKYKHEIHANEIVLLAYYIAAINIEAVYHSLLAKNGDKAAEYQPFEGICLTDTFQMYEKDDLVSDLMEDNSARRKRQKKLDIRVIMGNPPYSVGQQSANDNNQNVAYPNLDKRIRTTYAQLSDTSSVKNLYDSYIRAIRWASDRVGQSGVIGFVTNAGFLEAKTTVGLRKCLVEEFSTLYIFHLLGLRGLKTAGERAKREGGQIFGSGSGAAICISLLVKNPKSQVRGKIFFHEIGEYLTREQKLETISSFQSITRITESGGWRQIIPDEHGDWMNQRDPGFRKYPILGDKSMEETVRIFENYSLGLNSNRDAWVFNSSRRVIHEKMSAMIAFYNNELDRYAAVSRGIRTDEAIDIDTFVGSDPTIIKWSSSLKSFFTRRRNAQFRPEALVRSVYRPFQKQWLYFDPMFNHRVAQLPRIFPSVTNGKENIVIGVPASQPRGEYSVSIYNEIPSLHTADMVGSQYFPLYLYDNTDEDEDEVSEGSLFAKTGAKDSGSYTRRDGISDAGLAYFQAAYPGETITKEDLFYYIYGLLHSPDYRNRYADNLGKELPRIPAVKTAADFRAFTQAGRKLAYWHLEYETVACHPGVTFDTGKANLSALRDTDYRVTKMKFAKTKDAAGKSVNDKTTVIYNERITIRNIPLEAYEYVVSGKPALEWVMERQAVTTDKDSGITNDANLWATETMGNAKYPLELFLRVITVSLETIKIVNGLPPLGDLSASPPLTSSP